MKHPMAPDMPLRNQFHKQKQTDGLDAYYAAATHPEIDALTDAIRARLDACKHVNRRPEAFPRIDVKVSKKKHEAGDYHEIRITVPTHFEGFNGREGGYDAVKPIMESEFDALHKRIRQTVQEHNEAAD